MAFKYAVIGAGRMGIGAAYDLAKFGEAEEILLIDSDSKIVEHCAEFLRDLPNNQKTTPVQLDICNKKELLTVLEGTDVILSAVPYSSNLALTEIAIELGASMTDLGGHTGIVRKQLEQNSSAMDAGVTIVPDCGMGPGMNISLAVYAMSLLDEPHEVLIWDGGLPQDPKLPWNYLLTFNVGGLTNEYYGNAYFIRNSKVTEVPCFDGYELLEFQEPLGRLEAFVTSGGLSTAPWTFEGKLDRLENKTLRYPGHVAQFKAFSQLGLLEQEPVKVGETDVIPRELFHALLEPKITQPAIQDICVIRTKCKGEKDGVEAESTIELVDLYDEITGLTAMQKLTGWHASIVAILAAQGKLEPGALPVELAVPGSVIADEARRRGLKINEKIIQT